MEVFVARQPIFTSHKKIYGYELLFRRSLENSFPNIDGSAATSNLMSNIFFPFEFKELLGDKPGFINFTKKLLLQKTPLLLPKENFVIEVLEDVEPEEKIVSALSLFRDKGFTIALDDFVYHKKYHPMIALSHIIKFDLKATPLTTLFQIVENIRSKYKITLLAEKVETYDEFDLAKEKGFELFQGYFFSKPEVLSTKGISANHVGKLKLINEVAQEDLDIQRVEQLIKNDASISFKLLKFINSAYFNRRNPIDTIKDAVVYLGTGELRKFINFIVLSDLSQNKPNELLRLSAIRASMCEKCGTALKTKYSNDELFTLGLFSSIDAILDCRMAEVLRHIAFSEKMKQALLKKDSEFNTLLKAVVSFEKGDWKNLFFAAVSGSSFETKLPGFYLDSVKMANSFFT